MPRVSPHRVPYGPGVGRYKDSMDRILPIAPDCSILSMELGPVLLYNASYIERDLAQVIVHDYGPKILSRGRQAPEAAELPDAKKANYLECRNLENCVFLGLNQTITTDKINRDRNSPSFAPKTLGHARWYRSMGRKGAPSYHSYKYVLYIRNRWSS